MGGKSSSSSSSSNTTTTENYDQRVAVESEGIGIGAYAQLDLTVTDQGVVAGAAQALEAGLDAAAQVVGDVTSTFGEMGHSMASILEEQAESDAKEIAMLSVKIFGAAVTGLMVLWFFVRDR